MSIECHSQPQGKRCYCDGGGAADFGWSFYVWPFGHGDPDRGKGMKVACKFYIDLFNYCFNKENV